MIFPAAGLVAEWTLRPKRRWLYGAMASFALPVLAVNSYLFITRKWAG